MSNLCCRAAVTIALVCAPALAADPFWGIRVDSGTPLEPAVAVGPASIIQVGGFRLACFNRTGTDFKWRARTWPPIDTSWEFANFWAGVGYENGQDSRVIFDQFSQRFVVMSMSGFSGTPPLLYLAVSKTSDPLTATSADWDRFAIAVTTDPDEQYDFPGLGVNSGRIFVTGILSGGAAGRHHSLLALRRPPQTPYDPNYYDEALHPGNKTSIQISPSPDTPFNHTATFPMPAHMFGATPADTMYFVQYYHWRQTTTAQVRLIAATFDTNGQCTTAEQFINFGSTAISGFPEYDQQVCPPTIFDPRRHHYNPQNLVYRDGKLYFARYFLKSDEYGDREAILWYQVDTNGWPANPPTTPTFTTGVFDSGRILLENGLDQRPVFYKYPLVMPTSDGGMVLFVTRFLATGYADLVCTGRRAIDPPGALGARVTTIRTGEAGVNPAEWGDFEAVALDPLEETRVWTSGETGRDDAALCDECNPGGFTPCATCAAGGRTQGCFHSSVGSYKMNPEPIRILTLHRQIDALAPSVRVQVVPMDVWGLADQQLEDNNDYFRKFPYMTSVLLQVPRKVDGWTFKYWLVDGHSVEGSTGAVADFVRYNLPIINDTTVVPVYTGQ